MIRSELSGVNWRQVFGHRSQQTNSDESPEFVVVIQVNVSPCLDSAPAPKSFLLRSVREKQQHVSVVSTSIKEETIQEKSRAALTGYNQPSPPWKLSSHLHEKLNVNTSHSSANSQSSFDNFQLPMRFVK